MRKILASFVLGCSLACATAPKPVAEVESVAPLLSNVSREAITAEQLKGKVVLVDIWASWCRPCTESLPYLVSLRDELGSSDFSVITINVDADRRAGQAFLKELGLEDKLVVLNDPEAKQVEKKLGILRLPTTLFIDRTGKVRFVENGFFKSSKESMRARVKQLLAEAQPTASL